MIKTIVFLALCTSSLLHANVIKGSGASFPYKVYNKWIRAYYKETDIKIDYRKKGSSKGIQSIKKREVDFAGTDKPLSVKTLKKYHLYQFPGIIGAITIGYNLPNIKELKLSRKALVSIANGEIQYWDNPLILQTNKQINLPHKELTFVHRADGSGSTYNFTYYLSKISKTWHEKFGAQKSLNWPGDHHIGGKTNSGVAALLKQTDYSIGYIDYSDAKNNHISMASLQNSAGNYIVPTIDSFEMAAAKASFAIDKDFYSIIVDPKGEYSYPILSTSFILLAAESTLINKQTTEFFDWSYKYGKNIAKNLGFVPIPENLRKKVLLYWQQKNITTSK